MKVNPKYKYFGCAKRGCDKVNPDYLAFESGWPRKPKTWCLNHIPKLVKLKMKLKGKD